MSGLGHFMQEVSLWGRKHFWSAVKIIIIIISLLVLAFVAFFIYMEWYFSQIVYSDKKYIFYVNAEPAHDESYVTLYDGLRDVIHPDVYERYVPFLKNNVRARYDRVIVLQRHEKERAASYFGPGTRYVLLIVYVKNSSISSYDFGLERDGSNDRAVAYYTEGLEHYGDLVCVGYASAGDIAIQEISPERIRVQANLEFSPADGVEGRHLRCEDTKKMQIDEEFEFGGRYREIR